MSGFEDFAIGAGADFLDELVVVSHWLGPHLDHVGDVEDCVGNGTALD